MPSSEPPTLDYATHLGAEPVSVERPDSLGELTGLVRDRREATLIPAGGATQLSIGCPPRGPFSIVELGDALGGEVDHQSDDLTLVVPAGATIDTINDAARQHGQRLPLDPPFPERATIGGTVAVGTGGPLASRFGRPRDLVLGMTVLRADGTLVKAGGRVVKNVTGYDLMRLWCGSFGTLGIVTEVALRAYPMAETSDFTWPVASPDEGLSAIDSLYRADARPEVADLLWDGSGWRTLVRIPAAATSLIPARSAEQTDDGHYITSRDLGHRPGDTLTVRVAATPRLLPDAIAAMHAHAPSEAVVRLLASTGHFTWRSGQLPQPRAFAETLERLRATLALAGGSAIIERTPSGWDAPDPWGPPPGSFFLMQRARDAWDPDRRFNRGRYIGGL